MSSNPFSSEPQSHGTVTVDIISDIVCPWCWLGKQYFDVAVKASPDIDVRVNWRPFMLDAGIPETGMPYQDYMKAKFGTGRNDKFKAMRAHLETAASDAGIEFHFDDIPMRPNTLKAHLLIKWAAGQGKAHEVSGALFKAFFQDLKDVGDDIVLTGIANDIGMDGKLVKELLETGRDVEKIQTELAYFQKLGVTSVPTFIYNGTFAVSGGQPAEAHINALEKASTIAAKDIMTVLNQ
ncbi:MAG: DsbA family oxidoreductase [Robiginitomaculum sp.]|nr:DsbA family oxidoreductase [Robiginitomaculum sp.]